MSSCSQPLHEPASTWRIARLRPRVGARRARARGGVGGGRGGASASAVGAGVAELEALVDQREVGQQVVGGGVRDDGPVRVRAGAQAEPLDRGRRARSTMQRRRAARALDAADADRALRARRLGGGRARSGRSSRRVEQRRRSASSSSARCSSRACTSPAARSGTTGSKPVVGEPRAASRARRRRARRRARPARPRRARAASAAVTTPMSGRRSWNERVEEELAPAARDVGSRCAASSSRAVADVRRRRARARCRRRGRVPNRKRWPVSARVQPARALGERGEAAVAGGEADAGADGGDVVEVAPDPLELEQDRARARELGGRREAERLLAGVRVGDAVRDRAGGAGARDVARARRRASSLRRRARGRGACRRGARRGAGCGRRRRGSGSGRTRSRRRGSARPRPGTASSPRTGTVQRSRRRSWSTSGRSGSWPSKRDAVEVVRLALVPAGGRREVDDRRHAPSCAGDRLEPESSPSGATSSVRTQRAVGGGVQAGEAPAVGERRATMPVAVRARRHESPCTSASTSAAAGQPERGGGRARAAATTATPVSAVTPRRPGAVPRSRRRALPAVVSISACASPRKPSASRTAAAAAAQGVRPGSRRRRSAPR